MGVRGLTTYISNRSDSYLEPYKLQGCSLVVDANSLASNLYNWHAKCECAYGGDYDQYSNSVSKFFLALKKCGVTPLVVFDGGYETRKLGTVMRRLKVKIHLAKNVSPVSSKNKFFPLLMKEVFKDVLCQLKIAFAQCLLEADDEIAAIARRLGCPVLSYDSDFYVYDVLYIPFSTVNIEAMKSQDAAYFMSCSLYSVENFLLHFGGLTKSLIPLMATLLGNDYIKRSVFKNFYSNLKYEKRRSTNETEKRIIALLAWLQNETLETAVEKILLSVKKQYRARVAEQIRCTLRGYTQCSSELLPYLGISTEGCSNAELLEVSDVCPTVNKRHSDVVETESENEQECSDSGTNSSDEDVELNEELTTESPVATISTCLDDLPKWFKESFTTGNFPSYFIDMITLHSYFCSPQIEDYSLPFSHLSSLPIISAIFSLLVDGDCPRLTYYSRNQHHQPERLILPPVAKKYPSLATLGNLSSTECSSILQETLEFSENDMQALQGFPAEWRLYFAAVAYWARHCTQPLPSNCHIHALVLSVIALSVVDKHVGYYRSKSAIKKALADQVKTILERRKCEVTDSKTKPKVNVDNVTITDLFAAVTRDDCILLVENILPFHSVDPRVKGYPKLYSVATVHAFAQLQSILFHLIHLNALLSFPLPQCRTAHFFSGTLICNAYNNFKQRSDVSAYVESAVLNGAPSVRALYKIMVQSVLELMPQINKLKRKGKKHCNKSKNSPPAGTHVNEQDTCRNHNKESVDKEIFYHDASNMFCALGDENC